ncbi:MAG: DUF370 domain-containing protein [Candidatus Firestonebacteria bacterium]|nr:DUF370 domain-containing protein [Candidatus Firestonebacteria bacterium]
MEDRLLNVGFGNVVVVSRIVAIVSSDSAPVKRIKEEARERKKLIDATNGRKTRSVIITDSDHVVLSAIQPETMAQRFEFKEIKKDSTEDKKHKTLIISR